jgi:hypothetical protein
MGQKIKISGCVNSVLNGEFFIPPAMLHIQKSKAIPVTSREGP